ncbi:HTH domain-containing protein [Desertivirga arenae]|uniref:HTH domain-containing protein n=1 Tax=Desertivirga arenae TaxID=2810309 RepID=UPI001F617886|nr:HTH domain-containing protein [Pedobacter sp. SYSU D00823]
MHYGETVELVVRRDNISISELSRRLNVSRRSIYNWFSQENLNFEIICKIGDVLSHDFSVEFPELFTKHHRLGQVKYFNDSRMSDFAEDSVQYWKDKYINLLEKHNDYLRHGTQSVAAFNY